MARQNLQKKMSGSDARAGGAKNMGGKAEGNVGRRATETTTTEARKTLAKTTKSEQRDGGETNDKEEDP